MKIYFLLFWIWSLASTVWASAGAGPGEALFFYYAYQMDFYTYGVGNTFMAPKCRGKDATTPCTLKDFLYHVLWPKHKTEFLKGFASLDAATRATIDTISPDVTAAAKTLHDAKWFLGSYEAKAFFKGYPKGQFPSFSGTLQDVTNVIQAVRKVTPDSSLDTQLARARQGFLLAHGNRIADQSAGLLKDLGTSGIPGLKVQTVPITLPDGRVYNAIDTKATITASGITAGSDAETNLVKFVQGYPTSGDSAARHQAVLNTLSQLVSRVFGTPNC